MGPGGRGVGGSLLRFRCHGNRGKRRLARSRRSRLVGRVRQEIQSLPPLLICGHGLVLGESYIEWASCTRRVSLPIKL